MCAPACLTSWLACAIGLIAEGAIGEVLTDGLAMARTKAVELVAKVQDAVGQKAAAAAAAKPKPKTAKAE